jgi:hypothetical protein|tara:strand:- start:278 stop:628 length:351 start_codon:yes stop_codon:yes gene_type:complete
MDIEHTRKIIFEKISKSADIQSTLYPYVVEKYPHSINGNGVFLNISVLSSEDVFSIYNKVSDIEHYIILRETQLNQFTPQPIVQVPSTPSVVGKTHTYVPFNLTKSQIHLLAQTSV